MREGVWRDGEMGAVCAGVEMGSSWLVLGAFVLAVVAAAVNVILRRWDGGEGGEGGRVGDRPGEPLPYRACEGLLTRGEAEFYAALREAVEGEGGVGWVVMAKVRLLDLVDVPPGTEKARAWRSRIQSKHVDFVVCDRGGTLRPRVVVELDDRTHDRERRRERDEWVDRVLEGAGLRVVRVRARRGGYGVGAVREAISIPNNDEQ